MKLKYLCIALALTFTTAVPATAAVSEQEVAELRAQIAALSSRLAELEARSDKQASAPAVEEAPVTAASRSTGSWTDSIELSGDFRYRWETIDLEGSDSRERHRIRARPTLKATVDDSLEIGFGLATGGDSPTSTNQTLGNGGSSKGVVLDQAYFEWSGLANTRLIGGKFKNPLHRAGGHGLLWDDDWRPEGFALAYEDGAWFGTGLATWLEGDSRRGDELGLGLQGGFSSSLAAESELLLVAGYYQMNLAGRETLFDPDDAFGNSVNPDGTYLYDFRMLELAAELDFSLGAWPVSVFADYVKNLDADAYDTGWSMGAALGKASGPGSWRLRYAYRDLEADAVLGLLTDSNFGGGGTDDSGHFFSADYVLARNWIFRLTYFLNETNENAVDRGDAGAEELDYDRLILDFRFKY